MCVLQRSANSRPRLYETRPVRQRLRSSRERHEAAEDSGSADRMRVWRVSYPNLAAAARFSSYELRLELFVDRCRPVNSRFDAARPLLDLVILRPEGRAPYVSGRGLRLSVERCTCSLCPSHESFKKRSATRDERDSQDAR